MNRWRTDDYNVVPVTMSCASSGGFEDWGYRPQYQPTERCEYCGRTQVYEKNGGCAGCGAPRPFPAKRRV